ncbi:MAG: hypothetical protein ACM3YO_00270, partial [Bacteroidota bacterium]
MEPLLAKNQRSFEVGGLYARPSTWATLARMAERLLSPSSVRKFEETSIPPFARFSPGTPAWVADAWPRFLVESAMASKRLSEWGKGGNAEFDKFSLDDHYSNLKPNLRKKNRSFLEKPLVSD